MTDAASSPRPFAVRARYSGSPAPTVVEEISFEAAAAAFAEGWPHPDEAATVSILVQDLESGQEHCFRIDLHSGEAAPCG